MNLVDRDVPVERLYQSLFVLSDVSTAINNLKGTQAINSLNPLQYLGFL